MSPICSLTCPNSLLFVFLDLLFSCTEISLLFLMYKCIMYKCLTFLDFFISPQSNIQKVKKAKTQVYTETSWIVEKSCHSLDNDPSTLEVYEQIQNNFFLSMLCL